MKSKSIKILECGKIKMQIQNHVHLQSVFGHVKGKEVYFLQQGWDRFVEIDESEGEKWKINCFHKKLRSK